MKLRIRAGAALVDLDAPLETLQVVVLDDGVGPGDTPGLTR